jgi:hypothetical protein
MSFSMLLNYATECVYHMAGLAYEGGTAVEEFSGGIQSWYNCVLLLKLKS